MTLKLKVMIIEFSFQLVYGSNILDMINKARLSMGRLHNICPITASLKGWSVMIGDLMEMARKTEDTDGSMNEYRPFSI